MKACLLNVVILLLCHLHKFYFKVKNYSFTNFEMLKGKCVEKSFVFSTVILFIIVNNSNVIESLFVKLNNFVIVIFAQMSFQFQIIRLLGSKCSKGNVYAVWREVLFFNGHFVYLLLLKK